MRVDGNGSEPAADREVVITRVFEVPARLLFEAYTKPEHIKRWFGPRPWPVTQCEMDFRVGGRYRFQMTGPGGEQGPPFGGEYLEIIPNRKIVYDNGFEETPDEKMIVTVTFDEKDGQTTLTLHTLFATIAMKNKYVAGGYVDGSGIALDQLGDLAAGMHASASATMRA